MCYFIRMKTKYVWKDGFTVEVDGFGNVEGWENLGCMNGFSKEKERETNARTKGKKAYTISLGRCYTQWLYPSEKLTFSIDSSD